MSVDAITSDKRPERAVERYYRTWENEDGKTDSAGHYWAGSHAITSGCAIGEIVVAEVAVDD